MANLSPVDCPEPVDAEAIARPEIPSDDRHVDGRRRGLAKAPHERSREVTEEGTATAGEESRLFSSKRREFSVDDREHSAEHDGQATGSGPVGDRVRSEPAGEELFAADDRPLRPGNSCNRPIS